MPLLAILQGDKPDCGSIKQEAFAHARSAAFGEPHRRRQPNRLCTAQRILHLRRQPDQGRAAGSRIKLQRALQLSILRRCHAEVCQRLCPAGLRLLRSAVKLALPSDWP